MSHVEYIRLIALDGGGYVHKMLAFLVKYPTDRLTTTTDSTVCTAGLSVRQDNIYKYYSNNIQKTHRTRRSLTSEWQVVSYFSCLIIRSICRVIDRDIMSSDLITQCVTTNW